MPLSRLMGCLLVAITCGLTASVSSGAETVAACLLDATWSERNREMIDLHYGEISPSSMNECTIQRCFLSGLWGLMIRGVDVDLRDPRDYGENPEAWLWSYGGTSDLNVIACRIEGKASPQVRVKDGGAFYSDAPLNNAHKGGQGHRFMACNFRTNTRYMMKLGSTHRDAFFGCYFEGRYVIREEEGMKKEELCLAEQRS
ncbi:MAG: hypothetical protein AAF191_05755 [Verrucomicrobiota bacterium]